MTAKTHAPPTNRRRTIRVQGYDYNQAGAYFVTICTRDRECLLGNVVNGMVQLNETGRLVESLWLQTATVRPGIELDAYVVMPNHFHAVFFIHDSPGEAGATHRVAPTNNHSAGAGNSCRPAGPKPKSVGAIIGQFKSLVTKRLNDSAQNRGGSIWQRNYYEHVIRNEESLNRIREYISTNGQRWDLDRENFQATGKDSFDDWLATFTSRPGI
jgi:REP-associated tyrosine transposase